MFQGTEYVRNIECLDQTQNCWMMTIRHIDYMLSNEDVSTGYRHILEHASSMLHKSLIDIPCTLRLADL